MHQAPEVSFPSANLEVKIVLPVPFRGSLPGACSRRAGILLRESWNGLQGDNQTAHHEISRNVFDVHTASFNCVASVRDRQRKMLTVEPLPPSFPRSVYSFPLSGQPA